MQALVYPHRMTNTPLKRIRVDDDLWHQFGEVAENIGTDRTKILVAFMRRYVNAYGLEPRRSRSASPDHATTDAHSAT